MKPILLKALSLTPDMKYSKYSHSLVLNDWDTLHNIERERRWRARSDRHSPQNLERNIEQFRFYCFRISPFSPLFRHIVSKVKHD